MAIHLSLRIVVPALIVCTGYVSAQTPNELLIRRLTAEKNEPLVITDIKGYPKFEQLE